MTVPVTGTRLADLTTARVGGPARTLVAASTESEIVEAVRAADAAGESLLIISGGSNLLIGDDGFDGTVLHITSTGFTVNDDDATCGGVMVKAQAGQDWDELVRYTVMHAFSGLEALSGIPGSTGATPVQNVGAYGTDVSQTIATVRTYDRETDSIKSFTNFELKFGYRDSLLKRSTVDGSPRYVVLSVEFQLGLGRMSKPVRYAELARALGIEVGARAYANDVRREVLKLRAGKGMVLDAPDPDTWSTGSFFTNPIVAQEVADRLPDETPRYPSGADGQVKLSAAWLIEHAGFSKGFGLADDDGHAAAGGRASLSTKHTLAVTNRGGASASDLLAVAGLVRDGVERTFGIRLEPEPLLINCKL
ncbi:UDP-N-acetylmuramate dehydrogenase [Arthrobacter sedimenti]|uniref:UDP-N-acetylmuramate dehydrogenase n=1 Tax=Arthrobacter sedimenti TaxID=2694931 RepID=UPI000B3504F3|nr:UDP-N-acetylmuramate dehydrogenase [Arthrobacter sedimenti]OUM40125.1 UDP-N-acetylenolpyruvoylglucosamine reductase [Arthrobacter agilis]